MPNCILASDPHLRPDRPLCRTDTDWIEFQRQVMDAIVTLANTWNADLVVAGDVFDTPRTSPSVVNLFVECIKRLHKKAYVIAGNHSLLYHNQANLKESSVGILAAMDDEKIIYLPCEDKSQNGVFEHTVQLTDDITLVHTLVFPDKDSIPFGAKGQSPDDLFAKYDTKYIVTGDYHHAFTAKEGSRKLINPGCTTIQDADMIDYVPQVALLDTDADTLTWFELPNDPTMVTDNHLTQKKERDARVSSFIETVRKHGKLSLSFEANLAKALGLNSIPQGVTDIIEEIEQEDR